ncbi:MAG TPA: acyl carrier protein [Candidatus Polarisedimenticolia bacterium]|nr:acyl carrier protein [Candidatus Polarisedimenticolia bacterium]
MAVKDQLREFITRELLLDTGSTRIEDNTPLMEESLIDSMGIFSLASFIERQFGVTIGDSDMVPDNFGSIDALARLIDRKRARS